MTTDQFAMLIQRDPSTVRKVIVRIAIGIIIVPLLYGAISVYSAQAREQHIARKIEAAGGKVAFARVIPSWLPKSLGEQLPLWDRIVSVNWNGNETITDDSLQYLEGLASLQTLWLGSTQITDAGLQHLQRLTNLKELYLDATPITSAGLQHIRV